MADGTYRGFPVAELIDDFRLACVSRAIDDREITMQKQSRVFFQISGAGHEAIGLGLARHLRGGYDWFFPYYREQALVLGLGVTPTEILMQAVGSAEDPSSGGRQMPSHWGSTKLNIVTQSSPTGSQCIPAVGCAEASRYIVRRPHLPGCIAYGDELTYVSLGEGAVSEGEFWESLNTACNLHLPVLYVVPDNGFAISVPSVDQHPAPVAELVMGFRGLEIHHLDGTDYFGVREQAESIVAHIRAGVGPALIHADVVRPYSHSAADTQSKYRSTEELDAEAKLDPIVRMEAELIAGRVFTADDAAALRAEAKEIVAKAAAEALAARRPDPADIATNVYVLPDLPAPPATYQGGDEVPMGEAIKRTLHEAMAADERVLVFGEDVADAREAVLANVEGKGGVFGTTHGLQRAFGQARCFNTPLSEANIVGRAVGQAHPGTAAGARDPVLRLHLAGHDADQERGGHHPLALQRRLHVPDGDPRPDRRLPHGRGDLAQPVGRVDLRPRARAPHRLPVAGARRRRSASGRLPRQRPRAVPGAQAPAAPALHRRRFSARRLHHPLRPRRCPAAGRRPHHRDVGRHRREESASGGARGRAGRPRGRGGGPAHDHAVGPRTGGRIAWPAPTACSWSMKMS